VINGRRIGGPETGLAPTRTRGVLAIHRATIALRQSTIIQRICPRNGKNRPGPLVILLRSKLLCSNA
jgi:hypothetical protein